MDGSLREEVNFCVVEVTVMLGGARPLHVCMHVCICVFVFVCVCVCLCLCVTDGWFFERRGEFLCG